METDDIFYRHFMLMQQENRIYATWCKKHGISYLWMIVLDTLLRVAPVEPAMLADRLAIPRQSMTSVLDQLEKNGLIRRDTHSGDRRATRIALTEAGSWLYETEIRPRIGAINQCSLSGFTSEEAELFQRFLKRMYRNLTGMSLE